MEILNDFNTSVERALSEIDPKWKEYKGLIICGTHNPHDFTEMINKIRIYRNAKLPFLGICFGHQLAAIEYARNVLGHLDATSEEFYQMESPRSNYVFVVKKRPDGLKVGLHNGESYWHNYEVIDGFESMWQKNTNFITVQYHPEYQSSIDKPHPVLKQFIELCQEYRS